jgi:hypothetical protein
MPPCRDCLLNAGSMPAIIAGRQPDAEQFLGGRRHFGSERARFQTDAFRQLFGDDPERGQPAERFVVGRRHGCQEARLVEVVSTMSSIAAS